MTEVQQEMALGLLLSRFHQHVLSGFFLVSAIQAEDCKRSQILQRVLEGHAAPQAVCPCVCICVCVCVCVFVCACARAHVQLQAYACVNASACA